MYQQFVEFDCIEREPTSFNMPTFPLNLIREEPNKDLIQHANFTIKKWNRRGTKDLPHQYANLYHKNR